MIVESWLQESGMVPYTPVSRRSSLSVWRIAMLTGILGAPLASLYLSEAWKKWKSIRTNFTGYFFSSVFSVSMLLTAAMIINSMGLLIPLGVSYTAVLSLILSKCIVIILWITATATLCSSITGSAGAAVLSFGLLSIALLPGLSGSSLSWWIIAPLGAMHTSTESLSSGWDIVLVVAAHATVYFTAGYFLLRKVTC
jgi:hypothetical protein